MRNTTVALLLSCAASGLPGAANADLLGDELDLPNTFFPTGTINYTASSGTLRIVALPTVTQFPPLATHTSGGTLTISLQLDGSGTVIGGIDGNDFELRGSVAAFDDPLLTGEISAFGFLNRDGTTDAVDFRFVATGGSLPGYRLESEFAVALNIERSTFAGDFNVDWNGVTKGNVGPIPGEEPPGDPAIDIEKTTASPLNQNPTAADFDNEDAPNGPGIPIVEAGSEVTWNYLVTNTGEVPLVNVTVSDSQGVSVSCPQTALSVSESMTCTATGTAVNLSAGPAPVTGDCSGNPGSPLYRNDGVVTAESDDGRPVTDSDPSHYCNPPPVAPFPAIDVEKLTDSPTNLNTTAPDFDNEDSADGAGVPVVGAGADLIWTYQVSNTGDVPFDLAEVVLTDSVPSVSAAIVFDVASDAGADGVLSPGEVWLYSAQGIALNLQAPPEPLPAGVAIVDGCGASGGTRAYFNRATVSAPGASPDSDDSHYCTLPIPPPPPPPPPPAQPSIDLQKTTGSPANQNAVAADFDNEDTVSGAGVPIIPVGAEITWTYLVSNTGDVTLSDISVTDDRSVTVVCPQTTLAVAAAMTCTATGIALDLVNGGSPTVDGFCAGQTAPLYQNTGVVTAQSPDGSEVSDNDPSHYCNPPVVIGDPAVDLEKTTSSPDNQNTVVADFDNEDTAQGVGIPVVPVGSAVSWTYQVSNTGATALINVSVVDDRGVTVSCPQTSLAVGESMTCTATGTALDLSLNESQPINGVCDGRPGVPTYRNVAEVSGQSEAGQTVNDSDPSHYCNPPTLDPGINPTIDVEKSTDSPDNRNSTAPDFDNEDSANGAGVPGIPVGAAVTWTYQVSNTGSVPLSLAEVQLTDSVASVAAVIRFDSSSDAGADNVLSPGEVWTYTAQGTALDLADLPTPLPSGVTVVEGCAAHGGGPAYMNRATVTAPGAVADSDDSHYCNPSSEIPPPAIPTLSQWMLMVTAAILLLAGWVRLRRA